MNKNMKSYLLIAVIFSILFVSCKKDNNVTTPVLSEFASPTAVGKYFIKNDPNSVFKIPVGITTISNSPRTITFTVTSPTGAVEGQQYTVTNKTVTIPAGTAVDSISIMGIFAGYSSTRIDTLIFTITGGDVATFTGATVYKVILRKYCDVIASQITGDYTNTVDYYNGTPSAQGPYTASVVNWVSTGATTATAYIINLGATSDDGWGPFYPSDPAINPGIKATFDWTDPSSFKVIIAKQNYFPTSATAFAPISASAGTFSSCNNTITIPFTVVYGTSSYVTTTILKR